MSYFLMMNLLIMRPTAEAIPIPNKIIQNGDMVVDGEMRSSDGGGGKLSSFFLLDDDGRETDLTFF